MSRRDVWLTIGSAVLLGAAVARILTPERPKPRPLSVAAIWIDTAAIPAGQNQVRESAWRAPDDLYLYGWNPWTRPADRSATYDGELMLFDPTSKATLFVFTERQPSPAGLTVPRAFALPAGTGFFLRKGQTLTLRYSVSNAANAPLDSAGVGALVYYVPASVN